MIDDFEVDANCQQPSHRHLQDRRRDISDADLTAQYWPSIVVHVTSTAEEIGWDTGVDALESPPSVAKTSFAVQQGSSLRPTANPDKRYKTLLTLIDASMKLSDDPKGGWWVVEQITTNQKVVVRS